MDRSYDRRNDVLIEKLIEKVEALDVKLDESARVQHANTESIAKLTEQTSGLVEAWDTASALVKFGAVLGRMAKWGASFAILGTALAWIVKKIGGV